MPTGTPPPPGSMPPVQMSPAEWKMLDELKKISSSGIVTRPTRTIASGVMAAMLVTMLLAFVLGVVVGGYR